MAEFTFAGGIPPTAFNVYYEDGTLVVGGVEGTTYTDMGLTAGQEYCYYVTQILEGGGESDPSNVLCATPLSPP
jgi:fibronectin type 3 domain-containing protein